MNSMPAVPTLRRARLVAGAIGSTESTQSSLTGAPTSTESSARPNTRSTLDATHDGAEVHSPQLVVARSPKRAGQQPQQQRRRRLRSQPLTPRACIHTRMHTLFCRPGMDRPYLHPCPHAHAHTHTHTQRSRRRRRRRAYPTSGVRQIRHPIAAGK